MLETYSGIYSILSSDTHNDLLRIETRHLDRSTDKPTIYFNNQWGISEVEGPIVTVPGILIRSLKEIFEKFEIDKEQMLLEKHDEVSNRLSSILEK